MIDYKELLRKYRGKTVLITGNTGFKGSWMTYILLQAQAKVVGYSLCPPTNPALFYLLNLDKNDGLEQHYEDVRNLERLNSVFTSFRPEIVIHLAAQPIVREAYFNPVDTYSSNIMGTVNVCEAVRLTSSVKSFLNVTTDKVYRNNEWEYGYRETDILNGLDPYSNSKSCSELVTNSYRESFFKERSCAISTARAGNVIGGGDFSIDRIIPDCIRALETSLRAAKTENVLIRNPNSIRPYQHVLESIFAYLLIAMEQFEDRTFQGCYNVGPEDNDCYRTEELISLFGKKWNEYETMISLKWANMPEENAPHEANFLKLDCSKIKSALGWKPRWHIEEAVEQTVRWTREWLCDGNIFEEMNREIDEYIG